MCYASFFQIFHKVFVFPFWKMNFSKITLFPHSSNMDREGYLCSNKKASQPKNSKIFFSRNVFLEIWKTNCMIPDIIFIIKKSLNPYLYQLVEYSMRKTRLKIHNLLKCKTKDPFTKNILYSVAPFFFRKLYWVSEKSGILIVFFF